VKRIRTESILVALILLVALSVRMWGIDHKLPYMYHPDEPKYVAISQGMFKTGDLNPHFFNYPSLFFYINSFAYIPYYLIGRLSGTFHALTDILPPVSLTMGVTRSPMPTTVLLGRIITVAFSVGTVGLTFAIGKRLSGKTAVGLLASLMLAISPTNVAHSRIVTPDTLVTFFAAASCLTAVWVYQEGSPLHYTIAGVCVGLTASTKYNGALTLLPLLWAHVLRYGKASLKEPRMYLALLFCALGFLATTPFAVIDAATFFADLRSEGLHYATGHEGMEGHTLRWYVHYMWQTAGVIYTLAVLEILRGIYSRLKGISLLSIFAVGYFGFIATFQVRNDRTFLPLTPYAFVLAASFLAHLVSKALRLQAKTLRWLSISAIACLHIAGLALPVSKTITETIQLTAVDCRKAARLWIEDTLPRGAKVALESYAPFVEPTRFSVLAVGRMIEHTPEWYVENGIEYLVFSRGMYGRFYREPQRYGAQVLQYDTMFSRFALTQMFRDDQCEVRIYEVR